MWYCHQRTLSRECCLPIKGKGKVNKAFRFDVVEQEKEVIKGALNACAQLNHNSLMYLVMQYLDIT